MMFFTPGSPGEDVRQQRKSYFWSFWIVLGRCGSFWVVLGSLWIVVDCFGSFWVVLGSSQHEMVNLLFRKATVKLP